MKKTLLITLMIGLSTQLIQAQDTSAEKAEIGSYSIKDCAENEEILSIFNDQVDAFNKQDINRLVKNVSEDFKYFYISPNELVLEVEGKEKFRKSMEAYFSSGRKVLSIIENYTVDRNRISFKEVVSHLNS